MVSKFTGILNTYSNVAFLLQYVHHRALGAPFTFSQVRLPRHINADSFSSQLSAMMAWEPDLFHEGRHATDSAEDDDGNTPKEACFLNFRIRVLSHSFVLHVVHAIVN